MNSCLYTGNVRHRRFAPVTRSFQYRLFMAYLDLAELPAIFGRRGTCSATRRWAPARFRRNDYLGDPEVPLDEAIRGLVSEQTGRRPEGPIRLLTHLRYFGFCFNPVSFYFCFDSDGQPEVIVAEVSNTPWGERHAYVLERPEATLANGAKQYRFEKKLHVSPFIPMDMTYRCVVGNPGSVLVIHMENWAGQEKRFDATLCLRRTPLTRRNLMGQLMRHPFMTHTIMLAIYWQALLLWLRRVPFYPHPNTSNHKGQPL